MSLLGFRDKKHLERLVEQAANPKAVRKRLKILEAAKREHDEAFARARKALAEVKAERAELESRRTSLIAEERAEFEAYKAARAERIRKAIAGED